MFALQPLVMELKVQVNLSSLLVFFEVSWLVTSQLLVSLYQICQYKDGISLVLKIDSLQCMAYDKISFFLKAFEYSGNDTPNLNSFFPNDVSISWSSGMLSFTNTYCYN